MSSDNTVDSIPDRELIRRALLTLRPTLNKPMWHKVMETFGLGSTFSCQLCKRYGFDPYATKPVRITAAIAAGETP